MPFSTLSNISQSKEARQILPIAFIFFSFIWGTGFVLPVFNIYLENVIQNLAVTGMVISLLGILGVFCSIPFGILCDKFNPKKIIQLSLLGLVSLPILYVFFGKLEYFLIIRVVEGLFTALLWVSLWTYIYNIVDSEKKGYQIGVVGIFLNIASALSPVIGGLIAIFWFFIPFYVWSFSIIVALIFVTFFIKNIEPSKIDSFRYLFKKDFGFLISFLKKHYPVAIFIVIAYSLLAFVGSFLPILLFKTGIDYFRIGIISSVAYIPTIFMGTRIGSYIDRVGRGRAILIGMATISLSLISFAISLDFFMVLPVMVFFGLSQAVMFISLSSLMSDLSPEDGKGLMSGVRKFIFSIGIMVGPLVGGTALNYLGYSMGFMLFAFLGVASFSVYMFMWGERV